MESLLPYVPSDVQTKSLTETHVNRYWLFNRGVQEGSNAATTTLTETDSIARLAG
jgi:hypothetical protein